MLGPSKTITQAITDVGIFDQHGRLLHAEHATLEAWIEVSSRALADIGPKKLVLWTVSTLILRALTAPYLELAWTYALAKRRGFRSVTLRAWRTYWKGVGLTLVAASLFVVTLASLLFTGWLAHRLLRSLTLVPIHDSVLFVIAVTALLALAACVSFLDLSRAALCRGADGVRDALRWGSSAWSIGLLGDYIFWLLLRYSVGLGTLLIALVDGWMDLKGGWPMLALTQGLAFVALLIRSMWLSDCLEATARFDHAPANLQSGELALPLTHEEPSTSPAVEETPTGET